MTSSSSLIPGFSLFVLGVFFHSTFSDRYLPLLPKATPGLLLHYCRSQRGNVNILSEAQRSNCSELMVQGQRREGRKDHASVSRGNRVTGRKTAYE